MPRRRNLMSQPRKKPGTNNVKQAATRDERRAAAEEADRAAAAELLADLATEEQQHGASPQTVVKRNPLTAGQQARRRAVIIWKYVELGCPAKKWWEGRGGTLAKISEFLEQKEGTDRRPILEVLSKYVDGKQQLKSRRGIQQKLTHGETQIVADALERGHGKEMAAFIVSAWRAKQGKSSCGEKAVRTAFRNVGGITQKRGTTSTGSRDPESNWAKSRLAQAMQWKVQVVVPDASPASPAAPARSFKVEGPQGCMISVVSMDDDPLSIIGRNECVKIQGTWWPGQPAKFQRKKWDCRLDGYTSEFKYANGDVEPAYIVEHLGYHYPMRETDVCQNLPDHLVPGAGLSRIPLEGVAFFDEKHNELELGSYATKWENRTPPPSNPVVCIR